MLAVGPLATLTKGTMRATYTACLRSPMKLTLLSPREKPSAGTGVL